MKNRFYLRSPHGNTGSNMVFHAIDGKGYTTDLSLAHVYTLEEAQREYEHARDGEHPVSADHVDALAIHKIDHQFLPTKSVFAGWAKTFVCFKRGVYDGNDVYWMGKFGESTDFLKAHIYTQNEATQIDESKFIVLPQVMASVQARRTFDASMLNPRTMITGAGLRVPHKIKLRRRRKLYVMTRFNCPTCGKFKWQHNPFDFLGCNDFKCSDFKFNNQ